MVGAAVRGGKCGGVHHYHVREQLPRQPEKFLLSQQMRRPIPRSIILPASERESSLRPVSYSVSSVRGLCEIRSGKKKWEI